MSKQIRPGDTLACFWDVKQPTNKQTVHQLHCACISVGREAAKTPTAAVTCVHRPLPAVNVGREITGEALLVEQQVPAAPHGPCFALQGKDSGSSPLAVGFLAQERDVDRERGGSGRGRERETDRQTDRQRLTD